MISSSVQRDPGGSGSGRRRRAPLERSLPRLLGRVEPSGALSDATCVPLAGSRRLVGRGSVFGAARCRGPDDAFADAAPR